MVTEKMIKKVFGCLVVFVFLMSAISVFIPEVSAALRPYNHMGTVISKDTWNNTITIQTDYEYSGPEWTPYRCTLEGAAPNENALNEIKVGDYVEAYSLGAPGGNWVTLAKIKSIAEHEVITDIYGDSAGTLFYSYQGGRHYPPLLGEYMINYKNTPNCSRCYGCNCEALYTIVNISKGSNQIASKLLYPGQKCAYQGEIYCINITFLSGQAYAYPECTDEQGCCGPQAISDFVIHITTPTVKKPVHNLNTGESFSAYIQAAIDDPDTKDGHTIAVDPGTYWENVKVTKSLTITSTSGNPADTIVRVPHSDDPAFNVTANYVKIHGFTVKGVADEWLPPPPDEDPWSYSPYLYPPRFEKTGIYIDCADYCSISNNTCLDNENGIFIKDSNNNRIYNNICLYNDSGIYKRGGIHLQDSNNNRIYNNICSNNEEGILLCDSNNNSISNNNCSQNHRGISLGCSNNNSISNNNCSSNYYGIWLGSSNNNKLTSNTMVGNGLFISGDLCHYRHDVETSNTVNGKPLYYWKDVKGEKFPDGAGQVILVNCTDVVVEDQNINNTNVGMQVAFSSNITVKNNTCSNNDYGIRFRDSNNSSITNNTCLYNDNGIGLVHSSGNSISNNNCTNNYDNGIGLVHSSGNSISNNNCTNNYFDGIQLYGSYRWESNNNSITNNTCMNNNWGISISSHSSHNTIYHNSLRNNTKQAFDNTGTSVWDNGYPSGGNYWSDYRQKCIEEYNKDPEDKQCGLNQDNECEGDGIWDMPYTWIGGGTGAKDRYPLVRPLWNVG